METHVSHMFGYLNISTAVGWEERVKSTCGVASWGCERMSLTAWSSKQVLAWVISSVAMAQLGSASCRFAKIWLQAGAKLSQNGWLWGSSAWLWLNHGFITYLEIKHDHLLKFFFCAQSHNESHNIFQNQCLIQCQCLELTNLNRPHCTCSGILYRQVSENLGSLVQCTPCAWDTTLNFVPCKSKMRFLETLRRQKVLQGG